MTLNDFYKLTATLRNKIFMLLARGIIKAINNDEGTQKLQLVCLSGETLGDVERLQEYGFETFPDVEAESFVAFLNGNRETGVVLVAHDRRYRPKTLASGEVMLYTKFGQSIHLKADGSVEIKASGKEVKITCGTAIIDNATKIELGAGATGKVVTTESICAFTGAVHPDGCAKVYSSKT